MASHHPLGDRPMVVPPHAPAPISSHDLLLTPPILNNYLFICSIKRIEYRHRIQGRDSEDAKDQHKLMYPHHHVKNVYVV